MISDLNEQECRALLTSTTVGRIGFVLDERIEIFPVNYVVSGDDLLIRTSSDGALRRLADARSQAAFEIDYHDDLAGSGWSVLMHGRLTTVSDEEAPAVVGRVSPWAGEERETPLRFTVETMTGRRVHRDRH